MTISAAFGRFVVPSSAASACRTLPLAGGGRSSGRVLTEVTRHLLPVSCWLR